MVAAVGLAMTVWLYDIVYEEGKARKAAARRRHTSGQA